MVVGCFLSFDSEEYEEGSRGCLFLGIWEASPSSGRKRIESVVVELPGESLQRLVLAVD